MNPEAVAQAVRDDETDPDLVAARHLRERAEQAELELSAERRRTHWLRVVAFLAFVGLCTAAALVLTQRPAYRSDHRGAPIAELIRVMREHISPDERKTAIAIGTDQCVRFLEALREHRGREVFEIAARERAIAKLSEILR